MFSLRDLLLYPTDFEWHCFFISCMPSILVDNLNAPFPTLIGLIKPVFEQSLDEMASLYLQAKDTPFATPSPVLVDIDSGKVMQLERYHALRKVERLLEEAELMGHTREEFLSNKPSNSVPKDLINRINHAQVDLKHAEKEELQ
jgi:hypothetical protein